MFWRITGFSPVSPVEAILDKEKYTLEELLDEDEILQECKALNSRLINLFRERTHVAQLLHYIVEGGPDNAEKSYNFKFPFIACEIITCEVDIILKTLVEDEELMALLFSFLKPNRSHSTMLAGYFCKVVSCLILRKPVPLTKFVQAHAEIFQQLIDLIGITSIMEVLIRLIGADEHMYSSFMDSMHWLEDSDVLEMIVDKFSSSDSREVHANVAQTLCAITRCAPYVLTAKIFSPSFVGRLFGHALKSCRPKSVIVNSLTVCISLLEPKRPGSTSFHSFHATNGSVVTANSDAVDAMVGYLGICQTRIPPEENTCHRDPILSEENTSFEYTITINSFMHSFQGRLPKRQGTLSNLSGNELGRGDHSIPIRTYSRKSKKVVNEEDCEDEGFKFQDDFEDLMNEYSDLVKLLFTSFEMVLPTSYGSLQPPLGDLRLKIIEFISILLTTGNEDAEKELLRLGALQHILNLFFEYPFNNFLHHHVERIISCCLTRMFLVEHIFEDCDLVSKILGAEKSSTLSAESNKLTVPSAGRAPPRIGNIGHLTCLSNKLAQLANSNDIIKMYLQEDIGWVDWYTNMLLERNKTENIYQWVCGRPTCIEDRNRDSDDEDSKDKAFDKAIFLCGDYTMFDSEEAVHRSLEQDGMVNMPLEQDDESYFDDPAEVFSSLNLGDGQESTSAIINPYWHAFENDQANECTSKPFSSSPPNSDDTDEDDNDDSDIIVGQNGLQDGAMSPLFAEARDDSLKKLGSASTGSCILDNDLIELKNGSDQLLSTSEQLLSLSLSEETSNTGDLCNSHAALVVVKNSEVDVTKFRNLREERPEEHNNHDKQSENSTESSAEDQVIILHKLSNPTIQDPCPQSFGIDNTHAIAS